MSGLDASRTDDASVTTLELFFDLVFVLAITQCTTLMQHSGDWTGIGRAMLVLGLSWWAWVGYAWLTNAVEPELTRVRLAIFAAMAAFLVTALSTPHAFGSAAGWFAGAYAVVRAMQIVLFWFASRTDAALRRSIVGLACGSALGVALVVLGAAVGGRAQLWIWLGSLVLDVGGVLVFGSDGWHLAPGHFVERHGLIVIIALGESIVAIGAGAQQVTLATVCAGVLGVVVAAALWWVYFDVLVWVAERRLNAAPAGRVRNEMARDAFSIGHFPLVAGIDLLALGMRDTIRDTGHALPHWAGAALVAGGACYLVGLATYGWRVTTRVAWDTVVFAALSLALLPVAFVAPALVTLAALGALLAVMVAYKVWRYGEGRARVRARILDDSPE